MKDKSHMQMLREIAVKSEIFSIQENQGDFFISYRYSPVAKSRTTTAGALRADTLEHAIEKAYAALVAGGE